MRRSTRFLSAFILGLALALAASTAQEKNSFPGQQLFGMAKVVQLHLTLSEQAFTALSPPAKAPFAQPGFASPRLQSEGTHRNTFGIDLPWTKADLVFEGKPLRDIGIRCKGNYTYLATARSLKKSLKLDLNRHVDGQKLDGLTMLNLHCGVTDLSQARESLSYAFFREAGIPAPRTSFAELTLTVPGKYDNELVGVYTLVEQVNKGFLKQHFKDGKGMLLKPEGLQGGLPYLGTNWKAYADRYKPEVTPTDEQQKRLMDFTRLINSGSDELFYAQISTYLDVDAFLQFIAANALLSNLDSFLGFGHNYYLYLVPETKKFVFIPWDLDLSLATWPAVGTPEQLVELSINHPHAGRNKLIDRLFAIPQNKSKYLAIIKDLTATSFSKKNLLKNLDDIETSLKRPIASEAKAVAARKEGRPSGFGMPVGGGAFGQTLPPRLFIEKRTASVAAQLAGKTSGYEPKSFGMGIGPPPGGSKR